MNLRPLKIALVLALAVLGGIFIAQNTEVVTVRFLAWELAMSRILLLSGTMAIGLIVGYLLARLTARRKRPEP